MYNNVGRAALVSIQYSFITVIVKPIGTKARLLHAQNNKEAVISHFC